MKLKETKCNCKISRGEHMLWVENSDSWIMAHEAGHLMGLEDKYRDQKQDDGAIISVSKLGWEGNIMAQYNGIVDERNLAEIVE